MANMLPNMGEKLAVIEWLALKTHREPVTDEAFWVYVAMVVGLVIMAGLMSGLTIGLLSLDHVDIEVLKSCGTDNEKKYAAAVEDVLKSPHFLLCTLVVWNAAAMETLPIFLDRIADPFTAVILSVTVVLVFGEILPQSVCTKYGLAVGYYTKYILLVLMFIAFPVAYPLGALLDRILGKDHGIFRSRGQIKAFVGMHGEEHHLGGHLTQQEIAVISGALDLTHKTAIQAMTPVDKVFMLSQNQVLDDECIETILKRGHSRVPVYGSSENDIVGLILVKELLRVCLSKGKGPHYVSEMPLRSLPTLSSATPMYDVLQLFKSGRSHMALLCKPHKTEPPTPAPTSSSELAQQHHNASSPGLSAFSKFDASAPVLQRSRSDTGPAFSEATAPLLPEGEASLNLDDNKHLSVQVEADSADVSKSGGHEYLDHLGEPVGIVTIEDIIEELLGVEIVDETDQFVDNLQTEQVDAKQLMNQLPGRLRKVVNVALFKARATALSRTQDRSSSLRHSMRQRDSAHAVSDFGPLLHQAVRAANSNQGQADGPMNSINVQEAAEALHSWMSSHPDLQNAMDVISSAIDRSTAASQNSFFVPGTSSGRPSARPGIRSFSEQLSG